MKGEVLVEDVSPATITIEVPLIDMRLSSFATVPAVMIPATETFVVDLIKLAGAFFEVRAKIEVPEVTGMVDTESLQAAPTLVFAFKVKAQRVARGPAWLVNVKLEPEALAASAFSGSFAGRESCRAS